MSESAYLWTGIAIMALSTYAIRVLPMVLFRKKIQSVFVRSFLFYVPYTVLSAMTFPAIFYSTNSYVSAWVGTAAALIQGYQKKSLMVVALVAAAAALAADFLYQLF